jgi:HJR/Mrr/RecB family endonuclease
MKSKSILTNKSAVIVKEDLENNSMLINFNDTQKNKEKRKEGLCLTPKLHKNISEIKLKKV